MNKNLMISDNQFTKTYHSLLRYFKFFPTNLELTCDSIHFTDILNIESQYETIITEGTWFDTVSLSYDISEPGEYMLTIQGTNGCETSKT